MPSPSTPAAIVSTPATPTTPDSGQPGTEIVSRSGRKIKPKRFADDDISTTGPKGKTGVDDGQPVVKRAKRGSTTAAAAASVATTATTSAKSGNSLKASSLCHSQFFLPGAVFNYKVNLHSILG